MKNGFINKPTEQNRRLLFHWEKTMPLFYIKPNPVLTLAAISRLYAGRLWACPIFKFTVGCHGFTGSTRLVQYPHNLAAGRL